jgi:hypothetical protein
MIVEDWVDQAREMLGGGIVEQVNRLSSPYTPGDTTINLEFEPEGVTKGIPLCVGLTTFMVWAVAPATREVTVEPRWAGSPDVAAATGALVRVRPNVHTHRIFNAVSDILSELSSPLLGIYSMGTVDIPYVSTIANYDLTDAENLQGIHSVQFGDPDDDTDRWITLSSTTDWQLRATGPTNTAPSGKQLRINAPLYAGGTTLRVTYKASLGDIDTLADDVTGVGLPPTALDLPPLGAAARLAVPGEWRRSLLNAQPDTRRSEEVPAGAIIGGARFLQQKFESRVNQEVARLVAANPYTVN